MQQFLLLLVSSWRWDSTKASVGGHNVAAVPPFRGMSLHDYTAAFSLASYCMDEDGFIIQLNRNLCESSSGCTWKKRSGFETEQAWQAALTEEMMNRLTPEKDGNEKVGIWHVEVPAKMKLSNDIIARMEGRLGLSLEKIVISEQDNKRFFTVAGTASDVVQPVLNAGFVTLTPVPRILKVSPLLLEPVRMSEKGHIEEREGDSDEEWEWGDAGEKEGGEAAPAGAGPGAASSYSLEVQLLAEGRGSKASAAAAAAASSGGGVQALSSSWRPLLATRQHPNVEVQVHGRYHVLVTGLETRAMAYDAALLLAQDGATEMISLALPIEPANWHRAGSLLQSGMLDNYPLWDIGIHGEGQIVGVRDGNFKIHLTCHLQDPNHPTLEVEDYVLTDIPNHSKLVQVWGMFSGDKGKHGSGCAKNAAGFAAMPCGHVNEHGEEKSGVAYKAKLVLQSWGGVIPGGPEESEGDSEYEDWLAPAYAAGARIHSNSYGGAVSKPKYEGRARELDKFMYTNEDFLILFAAGNDGAKRMTNECGMKNGVCVGAIDDQVDKPNVKGFSGRGPTADGRIKPDVLAVGNSGTSIATPILAGASALVRQYFMDGYYPTGVKNKGKGFVPMAALIKAVLVNSAVRANVPIATTEDTFPSSDQGFGTSNLDNVLVTPASPPGLVTHVHGAWSPGCQACPKIKDQETMTLRIKIAAVTQDLPLRVTLTWTDYWSQGDANKALVNDLDLSLKSSGITYHPNGAEVADRLNTVERIIIDRPTPSATYTLRVKGSQVPRGPQNYALVISGPLTQKDIPGPPCASRTTDPGCPVDDDFVCVGDACFHVSDELYTKFEADRYCKGFRENGGDWVRACPGSWEQNLAIASVLRYKEAIDDSTDTNAFGWLALKAKADPEAPLVCVGETEFAATYSNWVNGEGPESWDPFPGYRDSYVEIRETGRWATVNRGSKRRAVCQNYASLGPSVFRSGPAQLDAGEQTTVIPALLGAAAVVVAAAGVVYRRNRSGGAEERQALAAAADQSESAKTSEGAVPTMDNPMMKNVRRRSTMTGKEGTERMV